MILLNWIGVHPVLAIILALIASWTLVGIAHGLSAIIRK